LGENCIKNGGLTTSGERKDEEGKDKYLCNGGLPMKEVDGKSKLS